LADILGINVSSDKNWEHLLGIVRAAIAKGKEVIIFYTYKGVYLIKHPDFAKLAEAIKGHGKMSACLHSWNSFELGDYSNVPGMAKTDFGTQIRHAELFQEMDRYIVL